MAKARPENPSSSKGWVVKSALLLILVCAFLGGIIWAGRWGLERLRGQDRYDVPFSEIDCDPPVRMKKQDFLDEVRFESNLPKKLNLLDEDLKDLLQVGFAKHHWVARVDDVVIQPPRQIIVKLTYRVPVMAVRVGDTLRAVDGDGVLLYTNAPTQELPIYDGDARKHGKAGMPWGDPKVETAARKLRK